MKKIILCCLELFLLFLGWFGVYGNPYWNSIVLRTDIEYRSKNISTILTYEEAKEDLDYLMKYLLKVHPMFIDGATKELNDSYQQALNSLKEADQITLLSLWREMETVMAWQRNAHTEVQYYSSDMHYLKDIKHHREWGEKLVAINGIFLETWFQENIDYISYELEEWGIQKIRNHSNYREGLEYLGIASDSVIYTYENREGELVDYTYHSEDFLLSEEYDKINQTEGGSKETSFVNYEIDQENHIGILTLTMCNNNSVYKDRVGEFFYEVKKNNLKNIILDLRNNSGGNSSVIEEFVQYLGVYHMKTDAYQLRLGPFMKINDENMVWLEPNKELEFDGNLYVLTSVSTYSSGMMFAEIIADNDLGKIVGEIPGNAPNHYGDISIFETPNTNLYITIPTKNFQRADESRIENYVQVDYECDARDALDVAYDVILHR